MTEKSEARAVVPTGLTTYRADISDSRFSSFSDFREVYLKSEVDALIDTLRRDLDEAHQWAEALEVRIESWRKENAALRAEGRAEAVVAPPEREVLRRIVEKLDVILPKVDSIIAFNTVRSGHQAYNGPNLIDELRDAKELLRAVSAPVERPAKELE